MKQYNLEHNINVFGIQVHSFPEKIGEAFEQLVKMLHDDYNRAYFGVSWMEADGSITYIAAAEEKYEGEHSKYPCIQYSIEKGNYLAEVIKDWRKKTDCIKDVFHEMMQDGMASKTGACIEWYKDDDEMLCMIKMAQPKEKEFSDN